MAQGNKISHSRESKLRAWQTRRAKYGPRWHSGSYQCCGYHANCKAMIVLIIKLHNAEILSEGQVAKATGLGRVEIRRLADEQMAVGPSP